MALYVSDSFKNAQPFIERIEGELGIDVNLIAQTQEARLGFMGAVRTTRVDPEQQEPPAATPTMKVKFAMYSPQET